MILNREVDFVMMINEAGRVTKNLLKRARKKLLSSNPKRIGLVINKARPELSQDFQDLSYYSRKYYHNKSIKNKIVTKLSK